MIIKNEISFKYLINIKMLNIREKNLRLDCFRILKFLYQQNEAERNLEDLKFEEDCYFSDEYDYLYI